MRNPFHFIDEVRQETSKVTWPAWKEVWITTAMVLVMFGASMFALTADFAREIFDEIARLGR